VSGKENGHFLYQELLVIKPKCLLNTVEDIQTMFAKALRPKAVFKALVSYEERELAKQAGFKWFPERKSWERKMTVEDARELAFPVKQIMSL